MEKISEFSGKYAFLSNFQFAPIAYDGIKYLNVESAYQAQKCETKFERLQFANLSPRDAKKKGRQIKLRSDWEEVKFKIMEDLVREKFSQNPELAIKLLETGDAILEEGNYWHDTIWGVCNGVGENHLGKILMKVREELKNNGNNI